MCNGVGLYFFQKKYMPKSYQWLRQTMCHLLGSYELQCFNSWKSIKLSLSYLSGNLNTKGERRYDKSNHT